MTDIVEASTGRSIASLATNASRHAGTSEWVVSGSESPYFDPPIDSNLTTGNLNGFQTSNVTNPSGNDFEVTIDGGEAFIGGAYCARDTSTTLKGDFTNGDRMVGIGWTANGTGGVSSDALTFQESDQFSDDDRFIPLFKMRTVSGSVSAADVRDLSPQLTVTTPRNQAPSPSTNALVDESALELNAPKIKISSPSGRLFFLDGQTPVMQLNTGSSITLSLPTTITSNVVVNGDTQLGFNSNQTKIDDVLNLSGRGSDPPSPSGGEIWYRSDNDEFRVREGATTKTIDTTTI